MSGNARNLGSMIDRRKLDEVIDPVAHAHGAEIVDVEWKPEQGSWVLRVFVEKLGAAEEKLSTQQAAVDLELCSNVARDLGTALDVADLIPHAYHLEVSSPGVERVLRAERDYVRFAGKKAKLRLVNALRGQKVVVGILGPVTNGKVALQDGGAEYQIPLADIESAKLVFEFGPAPKPGGKKRGPDSHPQHRQQGKRQR
jgi:ribosome maturation factor RimP